jgi:DNA topoisomerase-1
MVRPEDFGKPAEMDAEWIGDNNLLVLYHSMPLSMPFTDSLKFLHSSVAHELVHAMQDMLPGKKSAEQELPYHEQAREFYPILRDTAREATRLMEMTAPEYHKDIMQAIVGGRKRNFPSLSGDTLTVSSSAFFETLGDRHRRKALSLLYSHITEMQASDTITLTAKHRYLKKKVEESGNVTYTYSDKHVKERNKKKAERLRRLQKSLRKLRSQVKKDLSSSDPGVLLPALAVALIDETYERVGNAESASEMKHYGVTTWLKKHISFSGNKAAVKYVGKSGVRQKKEIKNAKVVKLLKKLSKEKKPGDKILSVDSFALNDKRVNAYLVPFDITAKDMRGFHANREMLKHLKEFRKKKLPSDDKEKAKVLKEEFKKALETTAKTVGHTTGALKNQYLIPKLEQSFLSGGKIVGLAHAGFVLSKRAMLVLKRMEKNR